MTKKVIINDKEYNTYATVEEADNYFAAKFGSQWSNIGENQKAQLLVTATRLIDKKDYRGVKADKDQPLQFPRIIEEGMTSDELLLETCCELAENIYNDGGTDKDISNIKSVSMGDSSITFKESDSTLTDDDLLIEKYLGDYLLGGVRVIL